MPSADAIRNVLRESSAAMRPDPCGRLFTKADGDVERFEPIGQAPVAP